MAGQSQGSASADGLTAAIDLGGTRVRVALFEGLAGAAVRGANVGAARMVGRREGPTPRGGPPAVVAAIRDLYREVLGDAPGVAAAGVAAPGPLDPATGVVYAMPNLPGFEDFPLGERLARMLGCRVAVHNDASLACLGEARVGAGVGHDPVVYLTVSTGVGGGIVRGEAIDGGGHGLAGELGHIIVVADGPRCNFGHPGCLEAVASGTAIAREARRALDEGRPSLLAGHDAVSAADVAAAARHGDPLAHEVLARAARMLGLAVGGLVNAFDPGVVVLGGGVMESWDLLADTIRGAAAEVMMVPERRDVAVVRAATGDDAGLWGAALLAWSGSG